MNELGIFLLCVLAVLLVIGFTLCCTPGFFTPSKKPTFRPVGDATLRRLNAQAREALAKERRREFKCVK